MTEVARRERCGQSRSMLARSTRQRLGDAQDGASGVGDGIVQEKGLLDEKVMCLVFKSMNWNPFLICQYALVCKRFADVMKRVIWKEFCLSRAPKMVDHLLSGAGGEQAGTIAGGWPPLGKLMFSCPGSHQSKHFYSKTIPAHFVWKSRFSRTSGKSFLPLQCRSDTLYISDCCEHLDNGDDDDLGVYRGIFRAFRTSKTRRFLIENRVSMEETELCPFCREKVWSMTGAQLVPPTAIQKLGAYKDNVDYFVCVNGHLHGMASLVSPSDSELSGDDQ